MRRDAAQSMLLPAVVLLLATYVLLAWSPFQWRVPDVHTNPVQVASDGALRIHGPAIVQTNGAPAWIDQVVQGSPLDIRLRVTAAVSEQSGPARILTLSENTRYRNLTIGQEGTSLVLRIRTDESNANGQPPLALPDVFEAGAPVDISVLAGPGLIRLEAAGQTTSRVVSARPFLGWDREHRLAFGNEFTGNRTWRGTIDRATVQVAQTVFNYLETEALRIPRWRIEFHRDPLQEPLVGIEPGDGLRNFLGFLPLGVLVGVWLRSRPRTAVVVGTAFAFLVSLTLETGQFFLPARSPSINDLILNTAGGLAGAMLAVAHRANRPRSV